MIAKRRKPFGEKLLFMDQNELKDFLKRFKINELRRLAKKLSTEFKRNDNIEGLIQKIITENTIESILNKLGLNNLGNTSSADESLEIARENLKIQKRRSWNIYITVFLAIPAFILGVYTLWNQVLKTENQLVSHQAESPQDSVKIALFSSSENYNILLLPFGSSQNCEEENIICEREVEGRFNSLRREKKIYDLEVQVFEDVNTRTRSLSYDKARVIGDSLGADLVVWGDYKKRCEWDSTKIRVKWVSLNEVAPFIDTTSIDNYTSVEDVSSIEEGELTGNIEEIVYWGLGNREMEKKKFVRALNYFEKISTRNIREYAGVFVKKADCYFIPKFSDGDRDSTLKAIHLYAKGIGLDSSYFPYATNVVDAIHIDLKDTVRAMKIVNRMIEKFPSYSRFYTRRGLIMEQIDSLTHAIEDISKAVALDSNYFYAFCLRGATYLKKGEYAKAIEDLSTIIVLNPNRAESFYNRGVTYDIMEEYIKAIEDYSKAIAIDPDNSGAFYRRGLAYSKIGEHTEAIEDYSKVIAIDPDNSGAFCSRGLAYSKIGEHTEAIEDYSKVIAIDPDNSGAFYTRGLAYSKIGEHTEAIEDYSKVIAIDPDNSGAFYTRGLAYSKIGEHTEAIEDYSKVIAMDPDNSGAFYTRGLAYSIIGEHTEAIEDYSKVIAIDPDDDVAFYNRGNAYSKIGEYTEAIEDYSKAIVIEPDDPDAFYNRGKCYYYLGEYAKCIKNFIIGVRLEFIKIILVLACFILFGIYSLRSKIWSKKKSTIGG